MLCIILNIVQMALIYDGMSDSYTNILTILNIIFSLIFILEAIIKITALTFSHYISVGWNRFDFAIVVSSVMDFLFISLLNNSTLSIYPQLARLLWVLRITRLFKLMKTKKFESFNKIIRTVIFSFPALFNVLMLLLLVYFIYSILGVFMF